jgi:hypothetical protein
VNLSALLEVEDPLTPGRAAHANGELALALLRPTGKFASVLEFAVDLDREGTPVRLAPAWYSHPTDKGNFDVATSAPIGLSHDAANLDDFPLMIVEFEGNQSKSQ